jgi:hypothetical protein
MRTPVIAVAALLGFVAVTPPLAAQDAPAGEYRQGFWIGFGLGPGHGQMNCRACEPLPAHDPWSGGSGYTGYFALGGTPRPNLLLGAELNGYSRMSSSSDNEANLISLSLVAQYYPSPSRAFVKVGAGAGAYNLVDYYYLDSFFGLTSAGYDAIGYALHAGAGYDIMLTSRLALVPFANVVQILARDDPDPATGVRRGPSNPRFAQLGIGLHWY